MKKKRAAKPMESPWDIDTLNLYTRIDSIIAGLLVVLEVLEENKKLPLATESGRLIELIAKKSAEDILKLRCEGGQNGK
jgi:hypothetical protein